MSVGSAGAKRMASRPPVLLVVGAAALSLLTLIVQAWIALELVPPYSAHFAGYIPIATAPMVLLSARRLLVPALVVAHVTLFFAAYFLARRVRPEAILAPALLHLLVTAYMWTHFSVVLDLP